MKRIHTVLTGLIVVFFIGLTSVLFSPLVRGLVILPLDLLISNYEPWARPGTILVKNPYLQDSILQMYPWKDLVFRSLRSGIIPFWNPYQMMGMPFMAGMKPMVWYPFTWLGIPDTVFGWNALAVIQVTLSLFFMYWCARVLGIGKAGSVLSAIVYSFNSLAVGVLEFGSEGQALLYMPLILLSAFMFLTSGKTRYLLLFGIAVSLEILSGQLQYSGYFFLFLIAFLGHLIRSKHIPLSRVGFLGVAGFCAIGVTAVQLGPSVELFFLSARGGSSPETFLKGLLPMYKLMRLVSPDFFGHPKTQDLTIGYIESSGYFGVIPLLLTVYAAITARKKQLAVFFSISFFVILVLSLQGPGALFSILKIPVITGGSGERIFLLVHLIGSLLSGYGLHEVIMSKSLSRFFRIAVVFFGITVILSAYLYWKLPLFEMPPRDAWITHIRFSYGLLMGYLVVILVLLKIKSSVTMLIILFTVGTIGLTSFDLFRMAYRFVTYSNRMFLYPDTSVSTYVKTMTARSMDRVYGLSEPDIPTALGIYSPETYNPLYPSQTARVVRMLNGIRSDEFPVNKVFIQKGDGLAKRALDVLGVRYVVVSRGSNVSVGLFNTEMFQSDFSPRFEGDKLTVFENRTVCPRYGIYYSVHIQLDDANALDDLGRNTFSCNDTVMLAAKPDIPIIEGSGSAVLLSQTVNSQQFQVTSSSPGIFYISDTYFPGWSSRVNGLQVPIIRANYAFRAVPVPAGVSTVDFSYEPTNFRVYIGISILSFLLLITMSFVSYARRFRLSL